MSSSALTTAPEGAVDPDRFARLRAEEYAYLDERGQIYLDYTGAGLPARSQLAAHHARIARACFGNPHSDNPTSSAATTLVERTRERILQYFGADPTEYAAIFTPNTTGACRLIGEAFPFRRGSRFVLTLDNHNSVNGIREFARARSARVVYVQFDTADLRVTDTTLDAALHGKSAARPGLLAYPAQSNFTGVRHPLAWIQQAHDHGYAVLLDAAAYLPTKRLDLAIFKPDFVTVSWYKVFGYPTGVGCLIARRDTLAKLQRPWFSGGTIQVVSAQGGWHRFADDETAFEDGTLNFLAIPDVATGLDHIDSIGIEAIGDHVTELTARLLQELTALRHSNGKPLVHIYGPENTDRRGATIAFNILDPDGRILDERAITRDSAARNISLRTGCFCNPGAGEEAFHIPRRLLRGKISTSGNLEEYLTRLGMPSAGAIRVSLGIASSHADLDGLIRFIEDVYRDHPAETFAVRLAPRMRC